jgi:hypothetical protein
MFIMTAGGVTPFLEDLSEVRPCEKCDGFQVGETIRTVTGEKRSRNIEGCVPRNRLCAQRRSRLITNKEAKEERPDAGVITTDIDVAKDLIAQGARCGPRRDITLILGFDEPDPRRVFDNDVNLRVALRIDVNIGS